MTDAEIKKALECCADELHWCATCPYFLLDKENDLCREDLCDDALYLINRQQAEIERLNKEIGRLSQNVFSSIQYGDMLRHNEKLFREMVGDAE